MSVKNQNPETHKFAEFLQLSHRSAGIPDYVNSASKANDWIMQRIEMHLGYDRWAKYLAQYRGVNVDLVDRITAISDALAQSQPWNDEYCWKYNPAKNRADEVGQWAMRKCYMVYTKFMDSFISEWKPSLIEWMLAVAIHEKYSEGRRKAYAGFQNIYKEYRVLANNMRLARLKLESAEKARDKFKAWYDEQTRALVVKEEDVRVLIEEVNKLQIQAEDMKEKFGFIEQFEKERAESD